MSFKKIICLFILLACLGVASAFANSVTYQCPAPDSIKVSNCQVWGSGKRFSTSCLWRATILSSAPLNEQTPFAINAEGKAMPRNPFQLIIVQLYRKTNRMRCIYVAEGQYCPKGKASTCFRGGALEWASLPGECHLTNSKVNKYGSRYCINKSGECKVICDE